MPHEMPGEDSVVWKDSPKGATIGDLLKAKEGKAPETLQRELEERVAEETDKIFPNLEGSIRKKIIKESLKELRKREPFEQEERPAAPVDNDEKHRREILARLDDPTFPAWLAKRQFEWWEKYTEDPKRKKKTAARAPKPQVSDNESPTKNTMEGVDPKKEQGGNKTEKTVEDAAGREAMKKIFEEGERVAERFHETRQKINEKVDGIPGEKLDAQNFDGIFKKTVERFLAAQAEIIKSGVSLDERKRLLSEMKSLLENTENEVAPAVTAFIETSGFKKKKRKKSRDVVAASTVEGADNTSQQTGGETVITNLPAKLDDPEAFKRDRLKKAWDNGTFLPGQEKRGGINEERILSGDILPPEGAPEPQRGETERPPIIDVEEVETKKFETLREALNLHRKKILERAEKKDWLGLAKSVGEAYNTIPKKYKYLAAIGLVGASIGTAYIGGAAGTALWLAALVGTPLQRAMGGLATFSAGQAWLESKRQTKERWWNKYPAAYAGVAGLLIGTGAFSHLIQEGTKLSGVGALLQQAADKTATIGGKAGGAIRSLFGTVWEQNQDKSGGNQQTASQNQNTTQKAQVNSAASTEPTFRTSPPSPETARATIAEAETRKPLEGILDTTGAGSSSPANPIDGIYDGTRGGEKTPEAPSGLINADAGPTTAPDVIQRPDGSKTYYDTIDSRGMKGSDSIWKSTKEIFMRHPEDFGYKGDLNDNAKLSKWAETQTANTLNRSGIEASLNKVHNGDVVYLEKGSDGKPRIWVGEESGQKRGTLPERGARVSNPGAVVEAPEARTPTPTETVSATPPQIETQVTKDADALFGRRGVFGGFYPASESPVWQELQGRKASDLIAAVGNRYEPSRGFLASFFQAGSSDPELLKQPGVSELGTHLRNQSEKFNIKPTGGESVYEFMKKIAQKELLSKES